jgi:transposase-like protein
MPPLHYTCISVRSTITRDGYILLCCTKHPVVQKFFLSWNQCSFVLRAPEDDVSDLYFQGMYAILAVSLERSSMVLIPVRCPYCHSDDIIKGGKTDTGKQRYRCQNAACPHRSFLLNPAYKGRLPEIKQQIVDMGLNGSSIRDTARVLQISPTTVVNELKKKGLHSKP